MSKKLAGLLLFMACSQPETEKQGAALLKCVKASDCEIGQACDANGQCVAAITPNVSGPALAPGEIPKVKVKSLAPYEVQVGEQNASAPNKILVDEQVASIPITELGIGVARIGMTRAEWFSVPSGEFVPAEPGDPPGVDARGLSTMDGAAVVGYFKSGFLCQLSTRSDHAATLLGVRPGDSASRIIEKYGNLSDKAPRTAEQLQGVSFHFTVNGAPVADTGAVSADAKISEVIVGACL
jgi:hypothetical protein